MESTADYLQRKRDELSFLYGYLDGQPGCPPLNDAHEVIDAKLHLRARMLAERAAGSARLTETDLSGGQSFHLGPARLRYGYLRFDLEMECPPLYPALQSKRARIGASFTSSGMAAISGALLALDRAGSEAVDVLALDDSYYETLHVLRRYTHRLRALVFRTSAELAAAAPSAPRVLLLDSICAAAPRALTGADLDGADLVLFDSTCYESDAPEIEEVVEAALGQGVPVLLLRSHTKLDSLGLEYGRLGSCVFALPLEAELNRLQRWRELVRAFREASARLGLGPVPLFVPPFMFDPRFRQLNRLRLDRIRANARLLVEAVRAPLLNRGLRVRDFHHGLFLTVEPAQELDRPAMTQSAARLALLASRLGVPARRCDSFGFDFFALAAYVDMARDRNVLRVSLADLPGEHTERFREALEEWATS